MSYPKIDASFKYNIFYPKLSMVVLTDDWPLRTSCAEINKPIIRPAIPVVETGHLVPILIGHLYLTSLPGLNNRWLKGKLNSWPSMVALKERLFASSFRSKAIFPKALWPGPMVVMRKA